VWPWECTRSPGALDAHTEEEAHVGGVLLSALPEIVRRVVVDQVPRRFGRAITIEDVDLNLFTRRLSARNVRVAARGPRGLRGGDAAGRTLRADRSAGTFM
jgi:hypothetical protein